MNSNVTTGWVLHQTSIGETSRWVTFFTKEHGLLKARVRGGRAPTKQALLQPFHLLWISLSQNLKFVDQLELYTAPVALHSWALIAAFYLNELLCWICQEQQIEAFLFDHYTQALFSLSQIAQEKNQTYFYLGLHAILRRFERGVLRASGFEPSFSYEVGHFIPIVYSAYYAFFPGEGFKRSEQGFLGEHLLLIGQDYLEDRQVLITAQKVMKMAMASLTQGMEFHSRKLWIPFPSGDTCDIDGMTEFS